jgi:hypothetical protein
LINYAKITRGPKGQVVARKNTSKDRIGRLSPEYLFHHRDGCLVVNPRQVPRRLHCSEAVEPALKTTAVLGAEASDDIPLSPEASIMDNARESKRKVGPFDMNWPRQARES